jgi:16S rRNA (uracil1498-N3)-methyltransferase
VENLFFNPNLTAGVGNLLDDDEAYHAIKVLRVKVGEIIKISNGVNYWVRGPITQIDKRTLKISVEQSGNIENENPQLILVQALTKSERIKEMLELVTAAGVDQVIPWQSQRAIGKWQKDSQIKWQQSIQEACKQSRRVKLPILKKQLNTKELIDVLQSDFSIVLHESTTTKFSSLQIPNNISKIYLVIGPEGGITDQEIDSFVKIGSAVVKLGEPILRSAHAGIAALSALQTKLGKW